MCGKKLIAITVLLILVAFSPFAPSEEAAVVEKKLLAVMDVELGAGVDAGLKIPLTMAVMNEVNASGRFRVMSLAERDRVLKEKGFDADSCKGEDCRIEAGRILGADYIVTGRVDRVTDSNVVVLTITAVDTGLIENMIFRKFTNAEAELIDAVSLAAGELASPPAVKPPPPPSPHDAGPAPPPPPPPGTCPDDMVYIPDVEICIDRYEYPNKKGEEPKKYVRFVEARELCRRQGKRLPTEEEFEKACMGSRGYSFGYGDKYEKEACNLNGVLGWAGLAPSGSHEKCTNDYGVYDMVGNVMEWTDSGGGVLPSLKGGSYRSTMPSRTTCRDREIIQEEQDLGWGEGYDFGFRCAKDAKKR